MRKLVLEALEERILYSANPVATVATEPTDFINDAFTFEVTFDNAADASDPQGVGYAPFIDITVEQGIEVNGASYLGTDANLTKVATWNAVNNRWEDGSGNAVDRHPYDPSGTHLDMPAGTADGQVWYRVDLPFGSFTPDQPVASIIFNATLSEADGASVGDALDISAQGGFRFGLDPLNNPSLDPPVQGEVDNGAITPTVIELTKELIAPESETATGENFERQYRLVVDIANGQTITDLNITDLLPSNIVLTGAPVITGGGSHDFDPASLTYGTAANGNQFNITFDSVTGTNSAEDIVIVFTFYVPELDADGNPVLNPLTGADSIAQNEAQASGTYHPTNGAPMVVTDSSEAPDLQLEALTIQKSASVVDNGSPAGTLPGDWIDYSLDFQVSDYFSVDNLVITDVLSDGQRIDTSTPFYLTLDHNGTPLDVEINPDFITITVDNVTGEQHIEIRLSAFLATQGIADGVLHGDATDGTAHGGTEGTISYRAQIQQNFDETYPSGDASVDLNDLLTNAVIITGRVAGTTNTISDDSGTETRIASWSSSKTIYAIDGDTDVGDAVVAPGDTVTYRISVTLPAADIEDLKISDFLPLPVFDVSEFGSSPTIGTGVPPAAGQISYGPNHTLTSLPGVGPIVPTVTVDEDGNRLIVDYGTFNDLAQTGSYTIEILYTVTVTDKPFADGLLLTNQAVISSGTTNNGVVQETEIQQIVLRQPVLEVTKGVLDTDSPNEEFTGGNYTGSLPGSFTSEGLTDQPIDADVTGIDAGDTVTFAITVMNKGGSGAYDILVSDTMPPGFEIPTGGLELQIVRGDGTVLSYVGNAEDLFTTGIQIVDPNGPLDEPALERNGDDGSDVFVITYKLVMAEDVAPGTSHVNTATIEHFAAQEGGNDFTAGVTGKFEDDATARVAFLDVEKDLVNSDQDFTSGNNLAVGEVATYQIKVTLPEGEISPDGNGIGLTVTDQLPPGFEIVPGSLKIITAGFGGTINAVGGGPIADGASLTSSGDADTLIFNFGEVVTNDDNVTANNSFTIEYQIRVANDVAFSDGQTVTNTVTVDSGTDEAPPATDDEDARIVLPVLDVEKTVEPVRADGGDTVTYTITVTNTGSAPSFDTVFLDNIPPELVNAALVSAVSSVHGNVNYFQLVGNKLDEVSGFTLAAGETITLTVTAVVDELQTLDSTITNTAWAEGTTLPGEDLDEGTTEDEDDAILQITLPEISKVVHDTSADHTDGSNLAIGEEVTYYITVTVPEATVPVTITDFIPAGMSYVSSSVVSTASHFQFSGSVPTEGAVSGNQVVFDFGTIENDSSAPANVPDTIVVAVTLRVDNVAGNQAESNNGPTNHNNHAQVDYGDGTRDAYADITIVEPDLTLTKSVSPTGGVDAGDTVTYTITITHSGSSTADAFDLAFSDTLPATLGNLQITGVTGPANAGNFTVSGNTITSNAGQVDLALGQTITLTITAVVQQEAEFGETITNDAKLQWTSLDGTDSNERGGGGGVNDYNDSDTASFKIDQAEIEKTIVSTSQPHTGSGEGDPTLEDLTIGETVTYRIVVTLPEGSIDSLTIADSLPVAADGTVLQYLSHSILPATDSGITYGADNVSVQDRNSDGINDRLIFSFGDVVNDEGGSNQIVIEVTALVVNHTANQNGDVATNTAVVSYIDGDGQFFTANDTAAADIVEPDLEVVKTASPDSGDAGDQIVYTITIQHTGDSSANAFDLVFADTLPPQIDWATATLGGANAGLFSYNPANGTLTIADGTDLPQGSSLTVTLTGTLTTAVEPGETVTNTAEVTWTSLNGNDPNERGPEDGYEHEDTADVTIDDTFDLEKTLADGQAATATIGEQVGYKLTLELIEGTTKGVVITDVIPAGMAYVDDTLAISIPGVPGPVTPVSVSYDSGTGELIIELGDIVIPADNDGTNNLITLTYTTVVLDTPDSANGVALENTATAEAMGGDLTDSDQAEVTVVEPELEVTKTVSPETGDAGDVVVYTITIQHGGDSSAGAFDLVFEDNLPSEIDWTTVVLGGADAGLFSYDDTTGEITIANGTDLPLGGTITLTVTGTLTTAVQPNQDIYNGVWIGWTSLDGDVSGERGPEGGGYEDFDDANVKVDGTFDLEKGFAPGQPNTATIGDEIDYQLTLTLIEGTTRSVVIEDDLPSGLTYVADSVAVTLGGTTLTLGTDYSVGYDSGTGLLTITLLNPVVVAGDNDTGNNTLVVTYTAQVDDIPANEGGVELTNEATATGTDGNDDPLEDEDEEVLTLTEPSVTIDKAVDPASGYDAGDSVTYTIMLTNSGGDPAYDLVFSDVLPDAFSGDAADVVLGGADAGLFAYDPATRTISIVGDVDLDSGDSLDLTVTVILLDAVQPSQVINNEASVEWSSMDGDVEGERVYDRSDDVDISIRSFFDLTKALGENQSDEVTIGDEVSYELTLALIEGTTPNVVITDVIPPGMEYVAGSLLVTIPGVGPVPPDSVDFTGGVLTIDLGDVVIPGDNDGTNNHVTLTYKSLVLDADENVSGEELTNSASATGGEQGELEDEEEVTVTVVEPQLDVTKDVEAPDGYDAGDTVTYTITIQHTGESGADAYDLVFADTLPAYIDPDTVQLDSVPSGLFSLTGNFISIAAGTDLAQGETITLTVTGTLATSVFPGQEINNEAVVEWTTQDGENEEERSYEDRDDVDITIDTVFDLEKSLTDDSQTQVTVGETVGYTLTLTLIEGTTPAVFVTDELPEGMEYVAGSLQVTIPGVGPVTPESVNVLNGTLLIDLGDVVIPGDNDGANNHVILTYSAVVLNAEENVAGETLTNSATATSGDGNLEDEEEVTVEIVEPTLEVTKDVAAPDGYDAGDTVTYTITIRHAQGSGADAYDIVFSDVLPPEIDPSTVVLSGANAGLFTLTDDTISIAAGTDLAQDGTITLTVTGTLTTAVQPNQVINNEATIEWTSQDGENEDERSYEDSDDADITVRTVFDLEKALTDESQAQVTIGETVGYTLTLELIEGTTKNVVVRDQIPAGMEYVAGSLVVTIPGVGPVTPASVDYIGGELVINLGDVVIPGDNDGTNNLVTFTYKAVVLNAEENVSGEELVNSASATGGEQGELEDGEEEVTVEVVEPTLEVTKDVAAPDGYDAGDTVTYTITIRHAQGSGADAYDIVFSDSLPPEIDPSTVVLSGANAGLFTLTGDTISIAAGTDLAQDGTITLTVTGTLTTAVQPNQVINNEATIEWTSQDGENDDERTYEDSDEADITVDTVFDLEKALTDPNQTTATIGDEVGYTLTLTLIEGTTPNVVVRDQIPAGMEYVADSLVVTIPGVGPVTPESVSYIGGELTINLGDVVIPGDNDGTNNLVTFTYKAVVLNAEENVSGEELVNSASATGGEQGELEDGEEEVTVEVVEPTLEVIKDVAAPDGYDAGDTVTYTITIRHAQGSGADAYDIVFSDSLPPEIDPSTVLLGGANAGLFTLSGNTISIAAGTDLAQDGTITLTVTGTLTTAVQPGQVINNEAMIEWTSTDGENDDERTYEDSDEADITVDTVFDLEKALTDPNQTTATIGDEVSYTLTLTLIEGTTPNVVVRDQIPAGMEYVADSLVVTIPGVGPVTPESVSYIGGELTIDLGDVVIPGDNDGTNNLVTFTYKAVVLNAEENVSGEELVNSASATGGEEGELEDGEEEVTVEVVEPELTIDKAVDDATPEPGQTITYTLVIEHGEATGADAYDLIIDDLISNPHLTLVAGSVTASTSGGGTVTVAAGNTAGDSDIRVLLDQLEQGETLTITYQVTVEANAEIIGDVLENQAEVAYDSQPGESEEERDYHDDDTAEVLVLSPDLAVVKTADVETLVPGGTAVYTLAIENKGNEGSNTATNVIVTDVLPLGLTYEGVSGLPAGAVADYDPDTRTLTISGFDMDAGDSYAILVTVSVDDPAPAGADYPGQADNETLVNAVSITADNFEPTPEDNEDEVPLELVADPDLAVTKVADVTIVKVGEQITYTVTVQNLGNQISTGVVVTDQLPVELVDFISASHGGVYDPDTGLVTWELDRLSPSDGVITFTLVVEVKATVPAGYDTLDNFISVEDDGQSGPDGNEENNEDEEIVELDAVPDLAIEKLVNHGSALQGDILTYTLIIRNIGDQGATGVVITDTLPPGLKFRSASDGGVYDPATGTVTWEGFSLAAGESMTVTLEAKIPDFYQPRTVENLGAVEDDGTNGSDPTPENNLDTAKTKIGVRYIYNALNGNFFGHDDEEHWGHPWDWRPPLLPIGPIYSGSADPGTQIRLVVYSEFGTEIASQTVMADTGGNWLASLPGALIKDRPHEVRVVQDPSINTTNGFLFNFRTYFSPATSPQQFFSEIGSIGGAGSFPSHDLIGAMIEGFKNPVFQPNQALYLYEFLASSSTTTQYAN